MGPNIQTAVSGNHARKAKTQQPRMDSFCSSGTFSTHLQTTQLSYKILKSTGHGQFNGTKRLYENTPCTEKEKKKKIHVNISCKSLENPWAFSYHLYNVLKFSLSTFVWRYQSVFFLLTEFVVWGCLCIWACGLTGRNSIIRRLRMCK